jgi:hypothetical protein
MGGKGSGRKASGQAMSPAEKQRRYRSRKLAGAPTIKAAMRELRFQDALRAALPVVKPEAPAWWRRQRKQSLEIKLGRVTPYA